MSFKHNQTIAHANFIGISANFIGISFDINVIFFQDEVADLKASKDVSHSTLEDLDTEDLYVKLKVCNPFSISS